MTIAICIRCGAKKHGAWTPCPACGFLPEDEGDLAKSAQLTDHYLDPAVLEEIGGRIGSGKPVAYDQAHLDSMVGRLKADPDGLRMPLGCRIAVWIPVVIMLALLVAVVALFAWLKQMAG